MLHLWHNLILMAAGRVVYNGPIASIGQHLSSLGYPLSLDSATNPVEWALELMAVPTSAQHITRAWSTDMPLSSSSSPLDGAGSSRPVPLTRHEVRAGGEEASTADELGLCSVLTPTNCQRSSLANMASDRGIPVGFLHQVAILMQRHSIYSLFSLHGVFSMLIRNVLGGALYGLLYYRNGAILNNEDVIFSRETIFTAYCFNMQTLQFAAIIFVIVINAISVPAMFSLTRLHMREQVCIVVSARNGGYFLLCCVNVPPCVGVAFVPSHCVWVIALTGGLGPVACGVINIYCSRTAICGYQRQFVSLLYHYATRVMSRLFAGEAVCVEF